MPRVHQVGKRHEDLCPAREPVNGKADEIRLCCSALQHDHCCGKIEKQRRARMASIEGEEVGGDQLGFLLWLPCGAIVGS